MKTAVASQERERLERHPLPQSMLFTPRFLGVEAPILGAELAILVIVANATQLRMVTCLFTLVALAVLHTALAAATRTDRRLTLVFARSARYPRYLRPSAPWRSRQVAIESTFPRRLLT